MKKIADAVLENRIVWSANRVQTLGKCQRKYYHTYVGSWLGWDHFAPADSQRAYRLKHLTTPQLEIGNIIHAQIRVMFEKAKAGRALHLPTEIAIAQSQFRDFVKCSARRHLDDLTAKRRKFSLHEMGESISADALAEYESWIALLLEKFHGFADVRRLLQDPSPIVWEHLDPPGFEIGEELGVPARPKTDAVFRDGDVLVVADWKCGAPSDDHRNQGLVYELYLRRKMHLPPEQPVEVRFYYLATGQMEAFRYCEEEQAEKLWQIGEDFEALRQASDDPVLNTGSEEQFHPSVSGLCFHCNFRLMCQPFQASALARRKEER